MITMPFFFFLWVDDLTDVTIGSHSKAGLQIHGTFGREPNRAGPDWATGASHSVVPMSNMSNSTCMKQNLCFFMKHILKHILAPYWVMLIASL